MIPTLNAILFRFSILIAPNSQETQPEHVHALHGILSRRALSHDVVSHPSNHTAHAVQSTTEAVLSEVTVDDLSITGVITSAHAVISHHLTPRLPSYSNDLPPVSIQSSKGDSRDTHIDWSPTGDWHLQKVFRGHTCGVQCVGFSHDGKLIVSGSGDRTVRLWNMQTGRAILCPLSGHNDLVFTVAFSPNDLRIASGSDDRTVRIWDVETGTTVLRFDKHTRSIWSVAFSPDGSKVVSSDDSRHVLMWVACTGEVTRILERPNHPIEFLNLSLDGEFIVGTDGKVHTLWNAESGEVVIRASSQPLVCPDLVRFFWRTLYTCRSGIVRRWNQTEGPVILFYGVDLSPDRKYIASADTVGNICLYARDIPPAELCSASALGEFQRL